MGQRVVVTGLGVWTANANDVPAFHRALKEGVCGIAEITQFDTSGYSCKVAGEIKDLPIESGWDEHLDRASLLGLHGVRAAIRDAELDVHAVPQGRLGVSFGTTCGGVLSLEHVCEAIEHDKTHEVPDWLYQELSFFAATDHVAREVGATGPVVTPTIACASGTHAVGVGMDFIRAGLADVMVVGGVDVISRFIYRGFSALNGLGAYPYRAFDKNRKGVVLGEGVGVLVLEALPFALERGARIRAELLGHSFNNDGCHIVYPKPDGEGIARSFRAAFADAGVGPERVDHINAHGTGTIANDSAETAGIRVAFGERAGEIPVASIKPMVGHTSGAAGALELIASIASLQEGFIPPTVNFEERDPACDLNISSQLRKQPLDVVVSANSGFGGSNAAVVVSKPGVVQTKRLANDRVVITGAGVFLPGIENLDALWERIVSGREVRLETGNGLTIEPFNVFAATGLKPTKDSRRMDQFSRIALMAALGAVKDAGISVETVKDDTGLVLGSAYACLESNATFCAGLWKTKVNPVVYQNTVSNAVTGYLAMTLGLHGPISSLNQGFLSGGAAVAYGTQLVKQGRVSRVLAGGVERLCHITLQCLDKAGGLTRPVMASSGGLIPSDGAAFVVLESLASAEARGARILGEIQGVGFRSAKSGDGSSAVAGAVEDALASLPESPADVTVFSDLSGVVARDAAEQHGVARGVSAAGSTAHVTGVKPYVGDTLGAAGPVSLVAALLAAQNGIVPGGGFAEAPKGAENVQFVSSNQAKRLDSFLINSTDADGSCVTLAVSSGRY